MLLISVCLAFTTKGKKIAPAEVFKYIGPASYSRSDLLTSSNWQPKSSFIPVDHVGVIVAAIEIKQNVSTYVDDQGTPSISDDVLILTTSLQADLTKAGGFDPPPNDFVQEVSTADYEILVNTIVL
jgi:hypothetical protein